MTLLASVEAHAATKAVDLDGNPANGAESLCELNVLAGSPVPIENKVTNRSGGDSFSFSWPSAGPGGFTSSVTAGTTGGVGATWVWTTNQSLVNYTGNTCANDICFTQTGGPDPIASFCSFACLADATSVTIAKGGTAGTVVLNWTGGQGAFTIYRSTNKIGLAVPANAIGTTSTLSLTDTPPPDSTFFYVVRGTDCATRKACTSDSNCSAPGDGTCVSRGPFGVPGRSQYSSNVTVSATSLTSSLITFFSPPTEVFRAISTAGAGGVAETVTNFGTAPVTVMRPALPLGCCPPDPKVPHQLRCPEGCVDYLNDPDNCGACGNVCDEGKCCSNGSCESLCAVGDLWCNQECADIQDDDNNCGDCGTICGDGTCCNGANCESLCPPGQVWCDNMCVDFQNDSDNCSACGNKCAAGTCCDDSSCVSVCPEGYVWCETACVDLKNDRDNCGACGNKCSDGTCCIEGDCESSCPEGRVLCGTECVDLKNDRDNCGTCGNKCGDGTCCIEGDCVSECLSSTPSFPTLGECQNHTPSDAIPGKCPNENQTSPQPGYCQNAHPSPGPVAGVCPEPGSPAPTENETAICTFPESTTTIPPGGSSTTCNQGGVLFKEVATEITVCGDGIPGVDGVCNNSATKVTTGTFNRLVPDPTITVGNAYVTPYSVHIIADTSNDGLIEPGETASLIIDALNAGPMNITNASATLSAPLVDLTDDGVVNPVAITVSTASVSYGTIFGTPASTNCTAPPLQPASNVTVFQLTVPTNHPGDTIRPLLLTVNGTVNGGPFTMSVPLVIGIGDKCDFAAHNRDYDGLVGLESPMAKLAPVGDTVPFPARTFRPGQVRSMKLSQKCGSSYLTSSDVDAPQIVALTEATRGAINVATLRENHSHTLSPFFIWEAHDNHWEYDLVTSNLGAGTYTITIRIAGRKNYVTGFVLQ